MIYCRYSSELQRAESVQDQERRCRDALERMGISSKDFVVLADEAISGTQDSRPAFDQLKDLIYSDRLGILAVAEQSRFSRGDNAKCLIKDIVFHGGRFISISEGVDTTRKGWKTIVGISEIHHSRSNEDTAERVRGGQEGRIRDGNGSAGDYPFGYTSEYVDPEAAKSYRGRGPKPKRQVVIDPAAAAVVKEVFKRFAAGQSMQSIANWWNEHFEELPKITRIPGARVRADHILRMVRNTKYIGIWPWGKTTIIYDGAGNPKQVPARPDQNVCIMNRPSLRIIEQDVWDAAQQQIAKLKEIFGSRPGDKKRGPAAHYRVLYQQTLLGGLISCKHCLDSGASNGPRSTGKLVVAGGPGQKRLRCANRRFGQCPMAGSVPYAPAERAILATLSEVLRSYPGWMQKVVESMRQELKKMADSVPHELPLVQSELADVQTKLANLIKAISAGVDGTTLRSEIAGLEKRKCELEAKLVDLKHTDGIPMQMPDDGWIAQELSKLTELLSREMSQSARHLRPLLRDVMAEQVRDEGQKVGYVRLSYTINGWAVLAKVLNKKLPAAVLSQLSTAAREGAQTFTVDLDRPQPLKKWDARIAEWRNQTPQVSWSEIGRRLGVTSGAVWQRYQKYLKHKPPQ